MKLILVILTMGMFTFSSNPSSNFEVVDTAEKTQLFAEIEAQLDIVDKVISLDLQQDSEGNYYYDVAGSKAGEAVSFTVEISSAAGGCSCAGNGALAPSPHFFWVCIVPCY